jgi:hypothetical protein
MKAAAMKFVTMFNDENIRGTQDITYYYRVLEFTVKTVKR